MPVGTAFIQRGVTWISGADIEPYTHYGNTARFNQGYYAAENATNSSNPFHPMIFRFPIPYSLNDIPVKVTGITIYYYTSHTDAFIGQIDLLKAILPGMVGQNVEFSYTVDLGWGETGGASASILSVPFKMNDTPYFLAVTPGRVGAGFDIGQIKVYGFRVRWEAAD